MRITAISAPLRRFLSRPFARSLLRAAGLLALGFYFAFAILVLSLRYAVLPQIENYRPDIEAALTDALKLPVTIRAIDAGWAGLRPRLALHGLDIRDAQGRPGLGLHEVRAELSWSSILHLGLRLHRLEIVAPDLDIRRDNAGRLFVAGLQIGSGGGESGVDQWVLAQDRIVIRDAAIRWHDDLRGAPALALTHLNFDLQNNGSRHRFGLVGEPPQGMAARLDLRGDLNGSDLSSIESWRGQVYGELDYADLAVWRTWIDYPVELPRGTGALRLWLTFADERATEITADVRLAGVQLRFAPELPQLDLARLDGRIKAAHRDDGYEIETRGLALSTRDGITVAPTDFRLRYRAASDAHPGSGELATNGLDLNALTALSAHLPLGDKLREGLSRYAPRGRLKDFSLAWNGSAENLRTWRVKGSFENLGLAAVGEAPGFAGLSGNVEGDEKAGNLALDSAQSALELPTVFPEPQVAFDALAVDARWKAGSAGLDVQLARAVFRNRDASGEAAGHYHRGNEGGPGEIDLSAKLTHAAGNSVWHYMPLAVAEDARSWLKDAITEGIADEATLRLKGDLARFPYADGKDGIFQVKGRFRDATLRYAPGWPEIRNISGDLLFEGARMVVHGNKGEIFGVGIGPVTAEIPNFDAPGGEQLVVEGRASGPTMDFLKFVDASPVGNHIDHVTEDMKATGNGELRLRLDMPLRHVADTKVDGRFRFMNDQLLPDPDMPMLTEVNGELHFTGERLDAQKIRANLLGMPLVVDVATAGDGNVAVKAAGTISTRVLAQQTGLPLFASLSGAAPWTGTVKVRKKTAEVHIESSLQGIASSLPEPFNKTTRDTLPLVLDRRQLPGNRSAMTASLDGVLKATLVRRTDGDKPILERGVVAIGTPPKLPERGVLFAVQGKRIDVDQWRRLLVGSERSGARGESSLPISQLDLRADELVAMGRSISNLHLTGTQAGGLWRMDVKSREVSGNVEWDGEGAGRISGHLTQLSIPETPGGQKTAMADTTTDEMPAIDLAIDHCVYQGKDLGAVKFKAENGKEGYWNARFDARNDDLSVDGTGRWRRDASAADTHVEVKISTKSIERLLGRLGYPEAVKRGNGNLQAALSWRGPPTSIDYASLNGTVKFEAYGGQFNKLEPGVGRLLGVLSLQSLPRRLTLDFRDVFSEGFAFDGIGGDATVSRGVMETKNLQIVGPAAKILMTGTVDLSAETQNLKVRVQPALGESIATGVLLAHPAAGAAAWVFNKLFGNPFDIAFSYQYAVTGSWADPKVEKVGQPQVTTGSDGPNVKEGTKDGAKEGAAK